MSNGNFDRLFKLWAKVCMLVVDGKRQPETINRALDAIGKASRSGTVFEHRYGGDPEGDAEMLFWQWYQINDYLFREIEKSDEQVRLITKVCGVLQKIVEMRFGPVQTFLVQFQNIMGDPRPDLEIEVGDGDFEILSCNQKGRSDLPQGVLTGLPQCEIYAEVRYRIIKS